MDALAIIDRLKVWTADRFDRATNDHQQHLEFTLIADEVEKALPSAYIPPGPDLETGIAGLNPLPLIAALWRAVQQLSAKVEALEGASR